LEQALRILAPIVFVLLAAGLFCAVSLVPHLHLVNTRYLFDFSLFAMVLAVLALALAETMRALFHRKGEGRTIFTLAACLMIFVPVYLWNPRPQPNVIVLVLDSLRADHLGCYGYGRPTSPNLDRFSEDALLFERCMSQSAGTDKSLPAIFASIYPSMFYDPAKDGKNFYVPDRFMLLSQYLKAAGYLTWAFSANPHISIAMNYARGCDEFTEFWREDCRPATLERYFREKVEASRGEPFYLGGLIIEPHTPYDPPAEFNIFSKDRSLTFSYLFDLGVKLGFPMEIVNPLMDLYDGEIYEADAALGRFLGWLDEEGHLDNTIILITSDHGEAFKEHGVLGHGGILYEERIHIPLIARFPSPLRFPELRPRGKVSMLTSQVDFVPTLLGFLGKKWDREITQGRNLIPYLYDKKSTPSGEQVFLEELISEHSIRCLRGADWKLITADRRKEGKEDYLFQISKDPEEQSNLAGANQFEPVRESLSREIRNRRDRCRRFYAEKGKAGELDRETLEKLRELGYGH
jgi:arylsulfatase A-like enzyme